MTTIVFLMVRLLLVVNHGVTILFNHLPWLSNHLITHGVSLQKILLLVKGYRLHHLWEAALGQIPLELANVFRIGKIIVVNVVI